MSTTTPNPDRLLHRFATFMGLPPDSEMPPLCGAPLTGAYDGRNRPQCPACERAYARLMAERQHHPRHITRAATE